MEIFQPASTIPEHQRELIEILNKVKLGEITVDNAEDLFKYWNFKHGDSVGLLMIFSFYHL